MEKNLNNILDEIVNPKDIIGCLVSDKQGLCLGMKGDIKTNNSGILTAIVERARNLNPSSKEYPIVLLETSEKQCIIQSNDKLVVSIVKSIEAVQ